MTRVCRILFSIFLLTFGSHVALATAVQVGGCLLKLPSYPTIGAALAGVAPLTPPITIKVCPGTYAEQVQISQALTLEGVVSGSGDQVLISVPAGGLTSTTSAIYSATLYPQVWVTGGPVNLSDITVDGTGATCPAGPATYLAGIFYASNSSGVINHVTTRYQQDTSDYCGTGIWAENTGSNA